MFELNVRQKWKIGEPGKEHHAFNMETMPDHVVKQKHYKGEDRDEDDWQFNGIGELVHAYELAPELVARVAKRGRDWAVVERLNAERVDREIEELTPLAGVSHTLLMSIADAINEDKGEIERMRENVASEGGVEMCVLFDKYVSFVRACVERLEEAGFFVDLYHGNVGYDKQGNLKLLDI